MMYIQQLVKRAREGLFLAMLFKKDSLNEYVGYKACLKRPYLNVVSECRRNKKVSNYFPYVLAWV